MVDIEALLQVPLFANLPRSQLKCVEDSTDIWLSPGDILVTQGEQAFYFYILLKGEIRFTQGSGEQEIFLINYPEGSFFGEVPLLLERPCSATGKALKNCHLAQFSKDAFWKLLSTCPEVMCAILCTMAERIYTFESVSLQREKLVSLGTMAAGLAHELNNPASAGHRAAQQLSVAIESLQSCTLGLCDRHFSDTQRRLLSELQQWAIAHSSTVPQLDPLTQSDKEDALIDWLEQHGIADGWQLAPTLVSAGVDSERLRAIALAMSGLELGKALFCLEATLTVVGLVDAVKASTARISDLVKAVKNYSYMDQAPLQEVNLHSGLESTLTILNHKLNPGITVRREYDSNLPPICAYGSELNQVWTNLIDNAIAAMNGRGELTIRTLREHENVVVEIADNGQGIPPEIATRIFEPFFTTKGVGEGTGLGLNTAYRIVVQRHKGNIRVNSQPGDTRFQVCLPIECPK